MGLFQPVPRAQELNKAIKYGLTQASIDANIDKDKLKTAARMYGILCGMTMIGGSSFPRSLIVPLVAAPVFLNLAVIRNATEQKMFGEIENPMQVWKELRQSLFVGPAVDRMLVANGIVKASRLVKARK